MAAATLKALYTASVMAVALAALPAAASARGSRSDEGSLAWGQARRDVALRMLGVLDIASFPNSIGPQRQAGLHTLAQYGFTTISAFDDGWAYAKTPDGSWEFGLFVLTNGKHTKRLCVTDVSLGGGTYRSAVPVDVHRGRHGLWEGVVVAGPVVGC